MIPIIPNTKWADLLKESPVFYIKSCNRKTRHDVYIIAADELHSPNARAVLYNTAHDTIITAPIQTTDDGRAYIQIVNCSHMERIWLDIPEKVTPKVEEPVIEETTIDEPVVEEESPIKRTKRTSKDE
jgi:hypothetical protein